MQKLVQVNKLQMKNGILNNPKKCSEIIIIKRPELRLKISWLLKKKLPNAETANPIIKNTVERPIINIKAGNNVSIF